MPDRNDEERPLLHPDSDAASCSAYGNEEESHHVKFADNDPEDPKAWSSKKKLTNVGIIALMAILSPLASSMFTPGIQQIADDFGTNVQSVIATTTGFVIMLGYVVRPDMPRFGSMV